MQQIKHVLRLKFDAHLSHRQIARSLRIGLGTVSLYLNRAKAAKLPWPLPDELDDAALVRLLFPHQLPDKQPGYVEPDYAVMYQELKRKDVTKQLLWEEYKQVHLNSGYNYSQFCHRYRQWWQRQRRSMRQSHKAGEKLFVDYCGPTVELVNPDTGEIRAAQIFVAVLGASNYTYAQASWSQDKHDWVSAHVNAFEFFGGVTEITVPDNLKSAITLACRYEPTVNTTYQHLASHYATAIIPARPYKPKDKAKAEAGVLLVQRWILARLRHHTFFTLAELNRCIRTLLDDLNQRPFKKLPGSRHSQFLAIDKPALRPLPPTPYVYTEFKVARVNIDYHIEFDRHYYSVPNALVKQKVQVQATQQSVCILYAGKQVARHPRSRRHGDFTTLAEHMCAEHRAQQQWTPQRLLNWAHDIGDHTHALTQRIIDSKAHSEQAYRACLGLLNLARRYGPQRLDLACARAIAIGSPTRRSVASILSQRMDQLPLPIAPTESTSTENNALEHDNIRGSNYYQH